MVHVVKNPFMEMLTFYSPAENCDKSISLYYVAIFVLLCISALCRIEVELS